MEGRKFYIALVLTSTSLGYLVHMRVSSRNDTSVPFNSISLIYNPCSNIRHISWFSFWAQCKLIATPRGQWSLMVSVFVSVHSIVISFSSLHFEAKVIKLALSTCAFFKEMVQSFGALRVKNAKLCCPIVSMPLKSPVLPNRSSVSSGKCKSLFRSILHLFEAISSRRKLLALLLRIVPNIAGKCPACTAAMCRYDMKDGIVTIVWDCCHS